MRSARAVLPPEPAAERVFAENLERIPESAAVARTLVTDALTAWELMQLKDTAALVLSELVSNAVNHARGEGMRVSVIRRADRRVRLSVIDRDRTRPRVRPMTMDGEGGRGLVLIDAVSVAWGVDVLPGGKRVWADLVAAEVVL
jgi:two-component sensor histidine kinase